MSTLTHEPTFEQVLDGSHRQPLPAARVVALIPAHNEEAGIVGTIRSLQAQSYPIERIVVMADNCTDRTVELALAAGAEVLETVDNKAKKAGALNQGIAAYTGELADTDYVICQDADGELSPDFLHTALSMYAKGSDIGGLSAAIVARDVENFVELSQAIEYARGTRGMARNDGKVHVLSGAAAVFPIKVLRELAAARGTSLPGVPGSVYMEDSLTEDYELTLAIKHLGYRCGSSKRLRVVTDVMPTVKDLRIQRLRWFRGALESVWLYGWNSVTHRIWGGIIWTFFASTLLPLSIVALTVGYFVFGTLPDYRYLVIVPLLMIEQVIVAKRVNKQAVALSLLFIPLWVYDNWMFALYWRSMFNAVMRRARIWLT